MVNRSAAVVWTEHTQLPPQYIGHTPDHNKPGMDVDTMFPSKTSVQIINIGFSKVSVVEFSTEKEATEAVLSVGDVPGGSIISLTDYLSLHAGRISNTICYLAWHLINLIVCRDKGSTEHCQETQEAG